MTDVSYRDTEGQLTVIPAMAAAGEESVACSASTAW